MTRLVPGLLARLPVDPYLIALVGTVVVASIVPAQGSGVPVVNAVVQLAVGLLFFLYGARLAPDAVIAGIRHWRLQSLVLALTFVLFPVLAIVLASLTKGVIAEPLRLGLLFIGILPSTVQSSIAFTSIARGNVPAALCAASLSNLAGILVTPVLCALLIGGHGDGFSLDALGRISLQLLLPFVLGQLARPWIGAFVTRHKKVLSYVDRGSILLVVYAAFSAGVVAGIWSQVGLGSLLLVMVLDVVLLALVLVTSTLVARMGGFNKEDEVAIVFCGSKKSLAAGIPMANVLFPAAAVGSVVLPLMLFHQIQLFACAVIARRYAARPTEAEGALQAAAVAGASR
ncbi:bile acid:sodium symporter family protein [Zavarzinia sp. CC-PAN008]|uniref:bile acid:sodium symporter family protein n=1 Tax=Zavarzinia sp. CC-PAN008 TaxID=3243332 RepID=UPI003F74298B